MRPLGISTVRDRAYTADVHIEDCWTSHFHCEIDESEGTLIVRDLESNNGTFLNGATVSSAISQFVMETHQVMVSGNRLDIGIARLGGSAAGVNAVKIVKL